MAYLTENMAQVLIVIGLVLMIVEVAVIGFATFVLFFVGIASVLTGVLMLANIVPETWSVAAAVTGALTLLTAAILWAPLKKLQTQQDDRQVTQDFNDHEFILEADIDHRGLIQYSYSGIDWRLKSENALPAGTRVHVIRSEVGVLWVAEK